VTKKRSRPEIYFDILKTIKSGIRKPTRIMHKTNLSWQPLKILRSFVATGLIIAETDRRVKRRFYELTEKGEAVLENLSSHRMGKEAAQKCVAG